MVQGKAWGRRVALAVVMGAAALGVSSCKKGAAHSGKAIAKPNTTDFATQVQQFAAAPAVPGLRWPNVADVQAPLTKFYTDRDDEVAWTRDGQPTRAATALIQLFTQAQLKGLNPEDYDASRWPGRVQRLAAIAKAKDDSDSAKTDVAQFDVALTVAAMRYLSDLHLGRVNPQTLNFDIDVPARRAAFDVATLLQERLVDSDDVAAVAESVEPQNPIYKATEAALPQYLALAKQADANPPAPLPALAKGAKSIDVDGTYPALSDLIARLQFEGYLPASSPGSAAPTVYTADLAAAVKLYQQRHGLQDDGKLGQATIDALNVPLNRRVAQMDDALERWRWLPEEYQQPRVLVNLPEFQLRAYEADHALAFKMRVVDGESKGHDTPMFVREMRFVVFRPYWNLPPSIVKKEIVPHLMKSGLDYLAAHGYEVTKRDGTIVDDATVSDIAHLRYMVRQQPGPKNSLGLVKFLFPNEYDVYMHSTPELNLFGLARRDKSHGCVRLQHADQMALWVLGGDHTSNKDWDIDAVHDAMSDEDKNNKQLNLKTPLPVVITYLTATGDEDGSVHFFADVYGYDKVLEAALAKGRPYAQGPAKINPTLTVGETE
jgi:murein L,D-transpeptidase YcbB/YkuD